MEQFRAVGDSVIRKEAMDKVTGTARYTNDLMTPGTLHAKMVISPYAHAVIKSIHTEEALKVRGVQAVVTGESCPVLQAAERVRVEYEPLPAVNSPQQALMKDAPLLHERLGDYQRIEGVYPESGTNIANRTKIRKGDLEKGWRESEVTVEATFSFPPSDHAAIETRSVSAEIMPDGQIVIYSATQSPYMVQRMMASYLNLDPGKIVVHVPLVGGAYGGKVPVQLELIAYVASKAVGGKKVKLTNSREEDMISSPGHIGLNAKVKLGASKTGELQAAEILYLFDGGAYSDKAVDISRAAAIDCTGPYRIENVWCDSVCVYTNHPYATAFRGFGHPELSFAVERTMDMLASKLGMDPLEFRLKNAIQPGDTTPTQVLLDRSTVGDLPKCIGKLRQLIGWDEGSRTDVRGHKVRAKGVSCFWKTSTIDTDAGSGVILTINRDGTLNLNCGIVEIGTGTKTALAQIVAERMKMDVSRIHVEMEVNTRVSPEHWKTVASRGMFMAGRAALAAADDVIRQVRRIASVVLQTLPEDLEVGGGRAYVKENPQTGMEIRELSHGHKNPDGSTIGGIIIGRGSYILRHLTNLDPETGKGRPGPEWTVGAEAVEVELDTRDFTYRIVKAVAVIDAGKVVNPMLARGQIVGGMSMGLSFASGEPFVFTDQGVILNPQLRTYKVLHFGEHPDYLVDFVETPHTEAPYGLRGIGEHGVIGMPVALGNSLSLAAGVNLNRLPLVPEEVWRSKKEGSHDSR